MNKLRTVSETKREFYTHYTRPINSVYRRVVEELMVEMHLLSVNVEFCYNPIYALGVITSYQKFMEGYQPENHKDLILVSLSKALDMDLQKYQSEAAQILALVKDKSISDILTQVEAKESIRDSNILLDTLTDIAHQERFKYSRLFATGLYTLLIEADVDLIKNQEQRNQILEKFATTLKLPQEKLIKDLDAYRSNLDKMEQILLVLEEALESERKKREKRETEKEVASAAETSDT